MRSALLLLALLVATGCDSTDDAGGTTCVSGSMTATPDGAAFAAECVTFQSASGVLTLAGLTNPDGDDGATQRQILLVVPGAAEGSVSAPIGFTGTYTDAELTGSSQVGGTTTAGLSGTLMLETLTDDRAAGSFSFSGQELSLSTNMPTGRTVAVTSGTFDIRL